MHVHSSLIETAALYAQATLGLKESDVMLSAAKLFFAYGLGNSLTFPLGRGRHGGADGRARHTRRPSSPGCGCIVPRCSREYRRCMPRCWRATSCRSAQELSLRVCNSAGEALPEDIARRWRERTGVDIVDGIGSTEMLHIFISNRPDRIRYGTLGQPVPGFEAKIVDEDGNPVAAGRDRRSAGARFDQRKILLESARAQPRDLRRTIGPAPAIDSASTTTATMCTPAGPMTCSKWAASTSRRSKSNPR